MTRTAGILCCALAVLIGASAAMAQTPSTTPAIDVDDGNDDILLIVKLTAKELKMDVSPSTNVEFPGTFQRATAWVTQRENMPEKLEPGVTYRNIGMTLRISSRFENIEQIVREALGEAPLPENAAVHPPPAPKVQTQTQIEAKTKRRSTSRRSGVN